MGMPGGPLGTKGAGLQNIEYHVLRNTLGFVISPPNGIL